LVTSFYVIGFIENLNTSLLAVLVNASKTVSTVSPAWSCKTLIIQKHSQLSELFHKSACGLIIATQMPKFEIMPVSKKIIAECNS
jgi:hypothetical protein